MTFHKSQKCLRRIHPLLVDSIVHDSCVGLTMYFSLHLFRFRWSILPRQITMNRKASSLLYELLRFCRRCGHLRACSESCVASLSVTSPCFWFQLPRPCWRNLCHTGCRLNPLRHWLCDHRVVDNWSPPRRLVGKLHVHPEQRHRPRGYHKLFSVSAWCLVI